MTKLTNNALQILKARYLRKNNKGETIETPEDMFHRVAKSISDGDETLEVKFYEMMSNLDFLPNSPTLWGAGTDIQMLSACYVLPIFDSIPEIFEALKQGAWILKMGGGVGYSFSRLRPSGSRVDKTNGISSGPISFMHTFNQMADNIKQGGLRRSAQMGMMNVEHPDIEYFVDCKKQEGSLSCFNISVAMTDKFMQAVEEGLSYVQHHESGISRIVDAKQVWSKIINNAWSNGEPGTFFIDTANRFNPTPEVGTYETTNPCGEIALLPYEACNLGSVNLANMLRDNKIDWDKLSSTVELATEFLDNVIDVNEFPLPEIDAMAKSNRKIGLGIMGWADMLIQLQISYDSDEAVNLAEQVMQFIDYHAKCASVMLSVKKGCFPNFQKSVYKNGIPEGWRMQNDKTVQDVDWVELSEKIKVNGIRNACVTTVAPTGTISRIAAASSGIEPYFAFEYESNVLDTTLKDCHPLYKKYHDEGKKVPKYFVCTSDVSADYHVKMQAAFQKYVDSCISKTVNLPNSATKEDVEKIYLLAHKLGCKGLTIYRDGSRQQQVLVTDKTKKAQNQDNGEKEVKKSRGDVLQGLTYKMVTGCGNIYVTINNDEYGNPVELFARLGKAGGCAACQTEGISRLVSKSLSTGIDPEEIIKQLVGITCHEPTGIGKHKILSCSDAIGKALKKHIDSASGNEMKIENKKSGRMGACPDCGSPLALEEGCIHCSSMSCGYSKCK